jgi:arylsulfatase A-like enzyme
VRRPSLSRRAFLALSGSLGALKAQPKKRPNVLLILADDLGFSDLGCYGGEIDTPNLNRLASNGVRCSQFYTTARCCPSRASLLSGQYPQVASTRIALASGI